MARITKFRKAILEIMQEYAAERQHSKSFEGLNFEVIADEKNHRYQLVLVGWQGEERIYGLLFHIDIINDKIWIQQDNTEYSAAYMLTDKGISKKDIVLGYFTEFHRAHGEFAVA